MSVGRRPDLAKRKEQQEAFLTALSEHGIQQQALKAAGIAATQISRWRASDPDFAARLDTLKAEVAELAHANRSKPGPKAGTTQTPGIRSAKKAESKARFLVELEKSLGVVQEACRVSGVSASSHYLWAREDSEYATTAEAIIKATDPGRTEYQGSIASEASKSRWADPEAREKQRRAMADAWTPEKRQAAGDRTSSRLKDPEYRQRVAAANKAARNTPEAREANQQRMRKVWANPEKRAQFLASAQTPERREAARQKAKEQWAKLTPEERKERMVPVRRAFKGGHRLTKIEALTIMALNARDLDYAVHKEVGGYVADFRVRSLNLVIECDGAWHHDRRKDTDQIRDSELLALGYHTLRLTEIEINSNNWSRLDKYISENS